MNIVIGGSYHKFSNEINVLHRRLEKEGHHVIAPVKDAEQRKVDDRYNYILFQGEETKNPVDVQKRFMNKIRKVDAFVVCNKGRIYWNDCGNGIRMKEDKNFTYIVSKKERRYRVREYFL